MKTIRPAFTPYQTGDPISVMYDDAEHGQTVATLKVERCTALSIPGRWAVTTRRLDGRLHDVTVDADGQDRHGYVKRPTPPDLVRH